MLYASRVRGNRRIRSGDGGFRRDLRGRGGGERAEFGGALRRDGAGPDRHPRGWQYDGVS